MKRILIFSLAYYPYIGGAEVAIKEITDRCDPNEYIFDMVTLRFDRNLPKVEKIKNITVYRVGFTTDSPKVSDRSLPFTLKLAKVLFPFTSFFKAMSLQWKNRYDMTWAMMANHAGFGALFFKYMHPRIPYVLELQDGNSLEQMKKRQPVLYPLWFLYKQIYLKADRIKVISTFIEGLVKEIGYTGPVIVLPNAVDTHAFSIPISEKDRASLSNHLGKKPAEVFLLSVSRLVPGKRVEDTITALTFLPNFVRLLIVGKGEDEKRLRTIASDLGVSDRVEFLGHVDHALLPLYYNVGDIFVQPSLGEGFGNVYVEAFAAGIPVVATPVGGIPDFLFDPERNPDKEPTGLFCEVRNPESIAKAVEQYIQYPTLRQKIVENARKLAFEKYDWNLIAKDMREKVFEPLRSRG